MSSTQTFLPWMAEHTFSLILVALLIVIAYIVYSVTFHRRIYPFKVARRITTVTTPSGSRVAYIEPTNANSQPSEEKPSE